MASCFRWSKRVHLLDVLIRFASTWRHSVIQSWAIRFTDQTKDFTYSLLKPAGRQSSRANYCSIGTRCMDRDCASISTGIGQAHCPPTCGNGFSYRCQHQKKSLLKPQTRRCAALEVQWTVHLCHSERAQEWSGLGSRDMGGIGRVNGQ